MIYFMEFYWYINFYLTIRSNLIRKIMTTYFGGQFEGIQF